MKNNTFDKVFPHTSNVLNKGIKILHESEKMLNLMKMEKITFENLKKLERKINKAYYKSKNPEYFFESKRGYEYARKWELFMTELRGWSEHKRDDKGNDLTKIEWIKHHENGSTNLDYNLGDICA